MNSAIKGWGWGWGLSTLKPTLILSLEILQLIDSRHLTLEPGNTGNIDGWEVESIGKPPKIISIQGTLVVKTINSHS